MSTAHVHFFVLFCLVINDDVNDDDVNDDDDDDNSFFDLEVFLQVPVHLKINK